MKCHFPVSRNSNEVTTDFWTAVIIVLIIQYSIIFKPIFYFLPIFMSFKVQIDRFMSFQLNIYRFVVSDARRQKLNKLKREFSDRRSGKNRRRNISLYRFLYKGAERRTMQNRRTQEERRVDWVRIDKWSSVYLPDLKIAKFLH